MSMLYTIGLLILSNIFMTFAWYGHLRYASSLPLMMAILISWGIAFFEYCMQVPANRIGVGYFRLAELKIIQEIITMVVFSVFSIFYMKIPISSNFLYAGICLIMAAYFIFQPIK